MIDPTELRVSVYDHLVANGLPPSLSQIAARFQTTDTEARETLASLRIGKTILVHPQTGEIWMAGPFASTQTSFEVKGRSTTWWGNCAWDMLGIPFITGESARALARCGDCNAPIPLELGPGRAPRSESVVHFLLPARQWYDDIGFT